MELQDEEICNHIKTDFYEMHFGNTPLFYHELKNGSTVFAKAEWFNPFGSIKDRGSFFMVNENLYKSNRKDKIIIVDGSSGNTGIAIGSICTKLGIKSMIFVPSGTSKGTLNELMKTGSDIKKVGSDQSSTSTELAIEMAKKLSVEHPDEYIFLHQHGNPMNYKSHIYTTGPETISKMDGMLPDHVAICMGTGGSIIGNGKYFKMVNPNCKVVMMQSNQDSYIQGVRNLLKAKDKVIIEQNIGIVDGMLNLNEMDAERGVKFLSDNYGIYVGFSSGANFSGALKIAEENPNSKVFTVFPDNGVKYGELYLQRKMYGESEQIELEKNVKKIIPNYLI